MYTTKIYDSIDHDSAWKLGLDFLRNQRLDESAQDEFWLANIEPCYTVGRDVTDEVPATMNNLSVVRAPRAGGWTYYNAGQLHVCAVFNHRRQNMDVAEFNLRVMRSITAALNQRHGPRFEYHEADPGIYTKLGIKVGSLGFHAHSGWIIGGVVLNYHVDLEPYAHIDVCGVEHRPMGNILNQPAPWNQLVEFGRPIIEVLTQDLYHANNPEAQ
jgi:lipoyl(octanoyl) transferase